MPIFFMKQFQKLSMMVCVSLLFLIQNDFAFGQLEFVNMFGERGDGDTSFNAPAGIALDSQDKIYIADFDNQRIQIWNALENLSFDSSIPVNGLAHGIEIHNDKIYVAVWDNPHVDIFTRNGTKISSFVVQEQPGDIAVNSADEIYVTSYATGVIQIFDQSGNIMKIIPSTLNGVSAKNTGIALDSLENIYVTDYINDRVLKLDPAGNFLFEFLIPSEEGGRFLKPTNIEVNADDDVYVSDNSGRIFVFDSLGNFLFSFGELGSDKEQMNGPHGISFDKSGYVYVAEMTNNRIQVFKLIDFTESTSNNKLDESMITNTRFETDIYIIIATSTILITIAGIVLFYKQRNSDS